MDLTHVQIILKMKKKKKIKKLNYKIIRIIKNNIRIITINLLLISFNIIRKYFIICMIIFLKLKKIILENNIDIKEKK